MTEQDVYLGAGLQVPDVDGSVRRAVGEASPVRREDGGACTLLRESAGQVGALAPCCDVPQLAGLVVHAEEKALVGTEYVAHRPPVGNAYEDLRVIRGGDPRLKRPVHGEHQQAPAVRAERQLTDGLSLPGKKGELPAGCRVPGLERA